MLNYFRQIHYFSEMFLKTRLLGNFRNIRILQIPKNSLVTTYLMNRLDTILTDKEFLSKLFQLLSCIRQLDYFFGFIVDQ